jgi:hypothetical protein
MPAQEKIEFAGGRQRIPGNCLADAVFNEARVLNVDIVIAITDCQNGLGMSL